VLVLAIAVLVVKNVGGGVGLVAPQAQRQAYVAEILGDVVIEPFDFGDIAVEALGEFLGFRADLRRWLPAVMIEAGVPAANFFPTAEGGQLDRWNFVLRPLLLLFPFLFLFSFKSLYTRYTFL